VTTANSGGFAGIRSKTLTSPLGLLRQYIVFIYEYFHSNLKPKQIKSNQIKQDMSSCRGFLIKVKGDGQRYKFISRDDDQWNGIAWSYSFDTVNGISQQSV
jgi:hypothetical protein